MREDKSVSFSLSDVRMGNLFAAMNHFSVRLRMNEQSRFYSYFYDYNREEKLFPLCSIHIV